jgi:hypothetical protein
VLPDGGGTGLGEAGPLPCSPAVHPAERPVDCEATRMSWTLWWQIALLIAEVTFGIILIKVAEK